ncbi:MAG: hypothetical protein HYZ57_05895, partial [Acidobacteria bacterium]|nr:hypothetical protein [Acidobacteriota bacterium]
MQWRKVLESPLRDAVRRDIPGDIAPLFGGINFIEGIERATVTRSPQSTLIILTGTFDLDRLRELAVEDGGVSRPYQSAELLLDPEGESLTQMALVSGSIVLIGRQKDLEAAVDRAGGRNTFAPPGPALTTAHLWVHSRTASEDIDTADLAVTLGDQVRIDAWAVARTPEAAAAAAQAARLQGLEANIDGRIVKASGQIAPRDFQ